MKIENMEEVIKSKKRKVPRPELVVQQFYEAGCHYATLKKYLLALTFLDKIKDPIRNPKRAAINEDFVEDYRKRGLKKSIEVCIVTWNFQKAFDDFELLKKYKNVDGLDELWMKLVKAHMDACIIDLEKKCGLKPGTYTADQIKDEQSKIVMKKLEDFLGEDYRRSLSKSCRGSSRSQSARRSRKSRSKSRRRSVKKGNRKSRCKSAEKKEGNGKSRSKSAQRKAEKKERNNKNRSKFTQISVEEKKVDKKNNLKVKNK